jgi:hypothetical protein
MILISVLSFVLRIYGLGVELNLGRAGAGAGVVASPGLWE